LLREELTGIPVNPLTVGPAAEADSERHVLLARDNADLIHPVNCDFTSIDAVAL